MGNKNSGRKSRYHEIRVKELADLSVNWAIDNWSKLEREEKLKIVLSLAPKYVPQKNINENLNSGEIFLVLKQSDLDDRISQLLSGGIRTSN
jgi:hypothetical protein